MQFGKILKSRFQFYTNWHILPSVGDNATTVSEFHFNVDRYSVYIEILSAFCLRKPSAEQNDSECSESNEKTPNGANQHFTNSDFCPLFA
jgi:hypothetical protein